MTDYATQADIAALRIELTKLILENGEARNAADVAMLRSIESLQAAVGEGITESWARRGTADHIPAARLGGSGASVYALSADFDLGSDGNLTGDANTLFTISGGTLTAKTDGVFSLAASDAVNIAWTRNSAPVFSVTATRALPPQGMLQGDVIALSATGGRSIKATRYAAVPTPIASVANLSALIEAGQGIEAQVVNGRLRIEAAHVSTAFERRVAWRRNALFTEMDFDGEAPLVKSTAAEFSLPTLAGNGYLGIWVSGKDRVVAQIRVRGFNLVSQFSRQALTIDGAEGVLYAATNLQEGPFLSGQQIQVG